MLTLTWLTLWVLRPATLDDGTGLPRQLTRYLEGVLLHFDFGRAQLAGAPTVTSRMRAGVPADLALLLGGIVVGTALGVGGGALAALRPRSILARAAEALALVAFGAPVYVVGLGLLLLFGTDIAALPTPVHVPLQYVEFDEDPAGWLRALLVPWLVLGLPLAGLTFRLMSGLTVGELGAPHVQTARAKGVGPRRVVLRHAARPALGPTLTLAGAATNTTLLNLALLEPVFGVPGLLRDLPAVVGSSDAPLLLGIAFVVAVLVVVVNVVVDLLVRAIDPAVRR